MEQAQTLAESLKAYRHRAGLSLRDLAEQSGVNKGVISRIESGERINPRPETLRRLAEALGIEAENLYVAAGWTVAEQLPSFRPYLRTKYGHLPDDKLAELESVFQQIADEIDADRDGTPPNR